MSRLRERIAQFEGLPVTENVYPLRAAWYDPQASPEPQPEAPRDDAVYRGLFVPGQMTDGQRFQAAVKQAVELGYDTDTVYVDAGEMTKYGPLKAVIGFTLLPWREPLRPCSFVFRDTRERPPIERPDDV